MIRGLTRPSSSVAGKPPQQTPALLLGWVPVPGSTCCGGAAHSWPGSSFWAPRLKIEGGTGLRVVQEAGWEVWCCRRPWAAAWAGPSAQGSGHGEGMRSCGRKPRTWGGPAGAGKAGRCGVWVPPSCRCPGGRVRLDWTSDFPSMPPPATKVVNLPSSWMPATGFLHGWCSLVLCWGILHRLWKVPCLACVVSAASWLSFHQAVCL